MSKKLQTPVGVLMARGVNMPQPETVFIGEDVIPQKIAAGVTIHPGCRLAGNKTSVGPGCELGAEAPVTLADCQLGERVKLQGGAFCEATFLNWAAMASGAHVRPGTLVEEEAGGAHTVGLKQTILFPYVILGSLINFCDCLMAGGTGRKDHSEVGSSYIHFNFTADGDKTTASLFGDVPRGVMLNQPAIFLGGQGGAVGPVRIGYGNVVTAGTILRKDVLDSNSLVIGKSYRGGIIPFVPDLYTGLSRIVENNILYLANLAALEQWYIHVRQEIFSAYELGDLICGGALDKLTLAKKERVLRLKAVSDKMPRSMETDGTNERRKAGKLELYRNIDQICELFDSDTAAAAGTEHREAFLGAFHAQMNDHDPDYVSLIKGLPATVSQKGTFWLDAIIRELCRKTAEMLPSLRLFKK